MKILDLINLLMKCDCDKEVKIVAQNGLHFSPELKIKLVDERDVLNKNIDNIDYYILC